MLQRKLLETHYFSESAASLRRSAKAASLHRSAKNEVNAISACPFADVRILPCRKSEAAKYRENPDCLVTNVCAASLALKAFYPRGRRCAAAWSERKNATLDSFLVSRSIRERDLHRRGRQFCTILRCRTPFCDE